MNQECEVIASTKGKELVNILDIRKPQGRVACYWEHPGISDKGTATIKVVGREQGRFEPSKDAAAYKQRK